MISRRQPKNKLSRQCKSNNVMLMFSKCKQSHLFLQICYIYPDSSKLKLYKTEIFGDVKHLYKIYTLNIGINRVSKLTFFLWHCCNKQKIVGV